MVASGALYVGVDTTSGRKAFTYAALDRELNVTVLDEAELDEITAFLGETETAIVAINAPSHLNEGIVGRSLELGGGARQLRGVQLRVAEHELRERGIVVSGTGSRESMCPPWMRIGFSLYRNLASQDYKPYPAEGSPHQWLETHPHAAYCALLERRPLSTSSLEGRLQRELILFERGVRIQDPMVFFEEITRHKLLAGNLPLDMLHLAEELDALVAAYTAWLAGQRPHELARLGSQEEGFIYLPAAELKDRYQEE